MFFSKKDKKEEPVPEPLDLTAEPTDLAEMVDIEQPVQKEVSAPLFVKVEKYRGVLAGIQEIKIFVSGMKQIISIIQELEAVRADAVKILRATLQRLERSTVEVDSELLRPKGFDFGDMHDDMEVHHIEDSLGDLQKQISILKRELKELR